MYRGGSWYQSQASPGKQWPSLFSDQSSSSSRAVLLDLGSHQPLQSPRLVPPAGILEGTGPIQKIMKVK